MRIKPSIQPVSAGSRHTKCPSCGSQNLQAVTETLLDADVTQKGFSGPKACLGWLLLGPFGLLCGNCGASQKTKITSTTKASWVCGDCGCKFRNLQELKQELDAAKAEMDKGSPKNFAFFNIGCIIFIAFCLFVLTDDPMSYIMLAVFLLIAMDVLFAVGTYMAKERYGKIKEDYDKLKKETTV